MPPSPRMGPEVFRHVDDEHFHLVVDCCKTRPSTYPTRVYVRHSNHNLLGPFSAFESAYESTFGAGSLDLSLPVLDEVEVLRGMTAYDGGVRSDVLPDGAIFAAMSGSQGVLRAWLDQDMYINARTPHEGLTLLHFACFAHPPFAARSVSFLIACPGIDVNMADRSGITPVELAHRRGLTLVVQLLSHT